MEDDSRRPNVARTGSPGWIVPAFVALGVLAAAGIWTGWEGLKYAQDSRETLTTDIQTMHRTYDGILDSVQRRLTQSERTNADLQGDLSVVTDRLRITQGQLKKSRDETQQIRDDDTIQLAAMDAKLRDQLDTKASADDVKAVSGEVSGVRSDLNTTKTDLQMARSEMGTLIAKNHDDIETLRRFGERDYVEFAIAAKGAPQKVGEVTIELRSTDPKKNQCNLSLVVDDKRTEKRNRTINEPIFFYAHGEHQAMEVVINQIEKNKVAGYLSIPKAVPQTASVSGN